MECLFEINFRSIQDDMNSEDILDRFRDHFRDHFRSFSGFKIGFEHGSKRSLTSVLFLARFWLGFGRPFGSKLVTFSVPGGGPCGSRPFSDLIICTFSIFSLLEPSWNHVAPDFGPFSGPFWEIFSCSETVFGGSFVM